ncbi:hypothetical protein LUZ60_008237 [Juncus effusus]|nr:hypothetical protein LUZ60_008237 [Juncus effusus]
MKGDDNDNPCPAVPKVRPRPAVTQSFCLDLEIAGRRFCFSCGSPEGGRERGDGFGDGELRVEGPIRPRHIFPNTPLTQQILPFFRPSSSSSSSSQYLKSMEPSSNPANEHGRGPGLTASQMEQLKLEAHVAQIYRSLVGVAPHTQSIMLELWRDKHVEYLTKGLKQLGHTFQVLDANRPWLCYWIIHAIAVLGETIDSQLENNLIDFLSHCQDKEGGYAGGPGQMPHLATTYAAVNTLMTLGTERAFSSINRENLYQFLLRMKEPSGAFRMHKNGEIDVRSCYTAISVASVLNILDANLARGVGDFIASCQTYEGGIGGEPHSEAHGGYTFCGLAAMILIDEVEKIDVPGLVGWVASRQGIECGFQGRVNKLVDGCYSFWQGACLVIAPKLSPISHDNSKEESSMTRDGSYSEIGIEFLKRSNKTGPLFHHIALQQYILMCSQVLDGGFRDKPGKFRDYYHTCYCLSGLSISQYCFMQNDELRPKTSDVLGPYDNLLEPVHPLYNIVLSKYYKAREFFSGAK